MLKAVASPMAVAMLFAASGAAALVSGVLLLAGIGWALVAGSVLCFALALILVKGMTDGP